MLLLVAFAGTIAVILGVILAVFIGLFINAMNQSGWTWRHFTILSYNWQTLIAGAFAVGAAFLAAIAVGAQIVAEIETEAWRKYNRERALRTTLQLALAELGYYAKECIHKLYDSISKLSVDENTIIQLTVQPLPAGLTSTLSSLIEASGDAEIAVLARLLRSVQIQHSRWNELVQVAHAPQLASLTSYDLASGICDAAEIYAQCRALMSFARDEGGLPGPTMADDLESAVSLTLINVPEEVEAIIALRKVAENARRQA